MLRLMLAALAAFFVSAASAQSWPDHVVSGMYGPPFNTVNPETTGGLAPFRAHVALAAGMPTYWSWSRGAVKMAWNNVQAPTAETETMPVATGRFGDAVPNTHGKNYRSHIRNYELWYFSESKRKWFLLDANLAKGGYYTKSPTMAHTGSMPRTIESDGSVSFAPKAGNWQHFYHQTFPAKMHPEKYLYLHVRAQMKLSGPDAATAKVLGNVGIDYKTVDKATRKTIGTAGHADGTKPQPAAFQAAMHYVTDEYTWFTSTTMTPDEIRANPPPAPADWPVPIPVPVPDPVPPPPSPRDVLLERARNEHRALGETLDALVEAMD